MQAIKYKLQKLLLLLLLLLDYQVVLILALFGKKKTYLQSYYDTFDDNITYELEEGGCTIPTINIEQTLFNNTLCSAAVAKSIQKMYKNMPTFSYGFMPFMSEVPYIYFHSVNIENDDVKSSMTNI